MRWCSRFVLLTSLALAIFGCGGDDGSGSGPTPTGTVVPVGTPTPTISVPPAGSGLVSEITGASIDSDGTLTVTFTLTDDAGNPITPVLSNTQDPQQARVRFTVAHIESYSGGGDFSNTFLRYVNDVNETDPGYDGRGTLATLDAASGTYTFTFSFLLPAGIDSPQTYTIGMQGNRTFLGDSSAVNEVFSFVPAGGDPVVWADVTTADCNTCHAPLVAHGSRFEVPLCQTCHTQAAVDDEGNSIDFLVMIHKIHAGRELPSIVEGPPGSFYGIYSGFQQAYVIFAEKQEDGQITGVEFPRDLRNCTACHGSDAPTQEYYLSKAAAAPCTSCHDTVNPSLEPTSAGPPGTGHFQERGFPDGECSFCHAAEEEQEFDVTVPGAHVVPDASMQLQGLNLEIAGITNHMAGQTPTVQFRITNDAGTALTDLSGLNRVGFVFAGPTTDYATTLTATAVGGGASGMLEGPDGQGYFLYTPAVAIPADATGTWSVGAESRREVDLETTPELAPKVAEEAAVNPVVTFQVDDQAPLARRTVVDQSNCQVCHGQFSVDFSIHGNLRNQVDYCVLCHNPNQSDYDRRVRDPEAVAEGSTNAPIDFKVLIHKIHRGEELAQQPYIVYGFGAPPAGYTKHDFGDVLFPGNLSDCQECHVPNSYIIPPYPGTALGTEVSHIDPETMADVVDGRIGPITTVCTACHDSDDAVAHAASNTAPGGEEACAVCHAEGRIAPVSVVHAEP